MTQRVEPGITEVALKPNGVCPARFQNCLGPVTVILCLFNHCIFGAENLFTEIHRFIDEMKLCLRRDYFQSLAHSWFHRESRSCHRNYWLQEHTARGAIQEYESAATATTASKFSATMYQGSSFFQCPLTFSHILLSPHWMLSVNPLHPSQSSIILSIISIDAKGNRIK